MFRRVVSFPGMAALLCGLFAFLQGPAPAAAIALYDAQAEAKVTLLGFEDELGNALAHPAGLSIIADASVFDSFSESFGTGNASFGGDALGTTGDMQVGDMAHLTSRSQGDAQLPEGDAFSYHDPEAFIEIDNLSGQTVRVLFRIAYGWDVSIAVDDLAAESAFADFYIDVLGGVDACGCNSDVDVLEEEFLDSFDLTLPGTAQTSFADEFDFSILMEPGDFAFIDMFIGTLGFADAFAVPAPGLSSALVPAAIMLWARRRRRPAA
jgi:hypothetical protein